MAIIDEVKRRAAQARFEAERLVRVNRTQTRISALQGQLNVGAGHLGAATLDLIARGDLAHPELAAIADQLLALRAHIESLDAELRAIRAEVFTEEPTSITCPTCGTVSAPDGRFCRKCGTPLQPGGQIVRSPPAMQFAPPYAPAPVEESAPAGQEIVCERCAATNPPGMRFCVHCGARLPIGTPGFAAPAWSAGTSPESSWPGAAPTSAPPSRSASREAPTVRMPTLDPARVVGPARTDPEPASSSAEEGDRETPGHDGVEAQSQPEQVAALTGPDLDASADSPHHNQAAEVPLATAEAIPATFPLREDTGDAPPGEVSADAQAVEPEHSTVASTIGRSVPICPSCGEPVVESAAFCVTCGTRVAPA